MGKSDWNILLKIVILPPISVEEAVQELSECEDLEVVLPSFICVRHETNPILRGGLSVSWRFDW